MAPVQRTLAALFACLLLCLLPTASADGTTDPHCSGARPLTEEERAYLAERVATVTRTKAALPSRACNTAHLPVVISQGALGTCSAFAACYYYKTYQEARERGWTRPDPQTQPERVASPAFGYVTNQQIPSPKSGLPAISYWAAAQTMADFGIGSWADLPYSDAMDITAWPTEEAWRHAIPWRGRQVGAIRDLNTAAGLATLKEHLAGGDLAVISLVVYENFDAYPYYYGGGIDNAVYYNYAGTEGEGHALCVVGYDDTLTYTDAATQTLRQGAFLAVNSWGTNWGIPEPTADPEAQTGGFIWIAYDFFLSGKATDTEAMVMLDRVGYTPTRLAHIGIDHPTGRVLSLSLLGGDREAPEWRCRALPPGNARPLQQRFTVDLSDYADIPVFSHWLDIVDPNPMGMWPELGTITEFSLETMGAAPLVSPDVPVQTVKNWRVYARLGAFSESGLDLAGLHLRDGSGAWGDYDADGYPDLALSGLHFPAAGGGATARTLILHNHAGASFSDSGAALLQSAFGMVAWADADSDGRLDLLVSDAEQGARLYRNTGSGFADLGLTLPGSPRGGTAWGDFDNDGRLDLAICSGRVLRFYRSTGPGFDPLEQSFAGPLEASLAWGDATGDGLLDLAVVSSSLYHSPSVCLYLNQGDDTFVPTEGGLPALQQGSVAWGDVDADGLLDLALSGAAGASRTAVYRSLGNGSFTPLAGTLLGVRSGAVVWGDADNDGHPDLLVTGREDDSYGLTQGYPNRSRLYRWTPDGMLDCWAALREVSSGFAGMADVEGDGDLDLLLAGTANMIYEADPTKLYTGLFRSVVTHPSCLARTNAPPLPPMGLAAVDGAEPGAVVLTWSDGSDAETPPAGLRYAVRVGRAAGACDVMTAALPLAGFGLLRRSGLPLRHLAPGTYHWAARSVDAGLAASAWSPEATFVVAAHTPQRQLRLAAEPAGCGTTSPAPGVHVLPRDATVPLQATAQPGYRFAAWAGDVANVAAPSTTVDLHENRVVTARFAVKYDLSPDWTEVSPGAAWGERYYHVALAFSDRLWVLGGTGMPYRHDVWSSADGVTWSEHTAAAGWSGRYGHAGVVFNGRLWILGGFDVQSRSDVWSSADGSTWVQETAAAAWAPRMLHRVVAWNGALWLLGGYTAAGEVAADVWRSTDGRVWTQVTAAAPWSARHSFGALVYDGRLWVMGGADVMSRPGHDVWSSGDGSTWTEVTAHADWPVRSLFGVAVLADRMWLLGGADEVGMGTADVWFSRNGATWTQAGTASGWSPRVGHGVAVLQNRLWVLGGNAAALCCDVWSGAPGGTAPGLASLFIDLEPPGGGTTTPAVGEHIDDAGTVFSISASSNPGFRFLGWSGPVADPDAAATTVTASSDQAVTARFEAVPVPMVTLTLALSPASGGTTTPTAGIATYPVGTTVPLTATPAHGYVFAGWSGAVAAAAAATTHVVMDSVKTITARFEADGFLRRLPVAAGAEHSMALKREGTVWVWGRNHWGQLGNGTAADSTVPYPIGVLDGVVALACGERHTVALRRDGTVRAWGDNRDGQLGNGTYTASGTPVLVAGLPSVVAVACGSAHSVALGADGTVWTWGTNRASLLGCGRDPAYYTSVPAPIRVPGPHGVGALTGITAVAAGGDHTLALRADGTVFAWGNNTWGQLGTGSQTPAPLPVAVPGLTGVRLIACGGGPLVGEHSLAVDAAGTLWAWGANGSGQVGDGTVSDRFSPQPLASPESVIAIAAGLRFSLALRADGTLFAWGDNTYGQLGDGSQNDRAVPLPVAALAGVAGMCAGYQHALAVLTDGTVRAWGRNLGGALGDGTESDRGFPVAVPGLCLATSSRLLTLATEPSIGGSTTPTVGAYHCLEDAAVPIAAHDTARYTFSHWSGNVTAPDAAASAAIMTADQTVTAHFDLSPGVQAVLTVTVEPPTGGGTVPGAGSHAYDVGTVVNLSARAGYRHRFSHWEGPVADPHAMDTSLAVPEDRTVTAVFTPTAFATSAALACGPHNTYLVRSDSTVVATGLNSYGQLGRGAGELRWPGPVLGADGTGQLAGVIAIAAGQDHTAALRYDGSVWTWGANHVCQLGAGLTGSYLSMRLTPAPVLDAAGATPLLGIRKICAGADFTLALADDGTLWAWGGNRDGQLGDGTTTHRELPVRVRGLDGVGLLTDVVDLACAWQHAVARRADGTWWGWGRNDFNALANPVTARSLTPVPMALPTDVTQLACGLYHTLARRAGGTVLAWGANYEGQLGDGTTTNRLSPVAVTGLTEVTHVVAGVNASAALRRDGTVWTWGGNYSGFLGNNSRDSSSVPVQVLGQGGVGLLTGIVAIACGDEHLTALHSGGYLYGWGCGAHLELTYGASSWNLVPQYIAMDTPALVVPTCTLRVQVSPAGSGTTLPDVSRHTYSPGDVVDLEARPLAGWRFVTWSGNAAEKGALRTTITLGGDESVTAHFEREAPAAGDVDGDGLVNATDASLCLAMAVHRDVLLGGQARAHPYPAGNREAADMDADGILTAVDAEAIMRRAAGLEGPVPDPYLIRPVVPPETHAEETSGSSTPGEAFTLELSDGSAAMLGPAAVACTGHLARLTNVVDLTAEGLQSSGSLRTLTLTFAAAPTEEESWTLTPVITIPYAEIGGLYAPTLSIARLSQRLVDGELRTVIHYLPVSRDRRGNLCARDVHLVGDLQASDSLPTAGSRAGPTVTIRYVPTTVQGSIDWSIQPQLVRMVPDPATDCKRLPLNVLNEAEQAEEMGKMAQNVIVLVHGHNEAEQAGLPGTFVSDEAVPWWMRYKREVWDYLYAVFLEDHPELLRCTVFYEFIYPTWRPIFGHLDQAFAAQLEAALQPQLAAGSKLNLFVVAHSMGGVVSRAGLQLLPPELDAHFRQVVTWGSPHHGAFMYSFRLAACSPYYELGDLGVVSTVPGWMRSVLSWYLENHVVLDTPGMRDLRWSNGPASAPRYSNLPRMFGYETLRIAWDYGLTFPTAELDLRTGSLLTNTNLALLNAADTKGDRLTCLYGVTEKGLREDMFTGGLFETLISPAYMDDFGAIAQGASINLVLTENGLSNRTDGIPECRSDGASPLISEMGLGITSRRVNLGNTDHEEYYNLAGKARFTARRTFEVLGLGTEPAYNAPAVTFLRPAEGQGLERDPDDGTVVIEARLDWPGDLFPGRRVKPDGVDLIVYDRVTDLEHGFSGEGRAVPWTDMIVTDTGQLSGWCDLAAADTPYAIKLLWHFRDNTELHAMAAVAPPSAFATTLNGTTLRWWVENVPGVYRMQRVNPYSMWYSGLFPPESAGATVTVTATVDPLPVPGTHELSGDIFGVPFSVVADTPVEPLTLTLSALCTEAGVNGGGLLFSYIVNSELKNTVTMSGWLPDPPLESRLPYYYNPNRETTP